MYIYENIIVFIFILYGLRSKTGLNKQESILTYANIEISIASRNHRIRKENTRCIKLT